MTAVLALFVGIVLGLYPGFRLGVWAAWRARAADYDKFRAAAVPYIEHGRAVVSMLEALGLPGPAADVRLALDNLEKALPERPRG